MLTSSRCKIPRRLARRATSCCSLHSLPCGQAQHCSNSWLGPTWLGGSDPISGGRCRASRENSKRWKDLLTTHCLKPRRHPKISELQAGLQMAEQLQFARKLIEGAFLLQFSGLRKSREINVGASFPACFLPHSTMAGCGGGEGWITPLSPSSLQAIHKDCLLTRNGSSLLQVRKDTELFLSRSRFWVSESDVGLTGMPFCKGSSSAKKWGGDPRIRGRQRDKQQVAQRPLVT